MNKINILGINISLDSKKDVLEKIEHFFSDGLQHRIVTPNPEIILEAHNDEEYFYILNTADIAIPDGIGIKIAGLILKKNIKRIAGSELTADILKLAEKQKKKIVVFNWRKGLSKKEDIENKIKKLYPKLNFIVEDIDREWALPYYQNVNIFKPEIAIVALGFPWQDKFVYHELPKMSYIKLGIGVGGSIDYLTGKIKEPPKLFRKLGLEWFWRLLNIFRYTNKKKRLKRIYNAIIVFPLKFFGWRYIQPFLYRPNVACMLYKKAERHDTTNVAPASNASLRADRHANEKSSNYKILIVKRNEKEDHWQLPQGGLSGDDIKTAGIKELNEELNTNKFKFIAIYKNLYKYKFGERNGETAHRGTIAKKHTGYKGQKQGLLIAEFYGKDRDIKINFWDHTDWKWVDSENLVESVHPMRKKSAKIYLDKFNEVIE